MEYVKLGSSGLEVSRVCLGCMTFGMPGERPWMLDEEAGRSIIRRALELGINVFDTANCYSQGSSEEILGRALKDFARRDEVVVATKVYFPMASGPNRAGLSRKAIMNEIDASLRRLGTDHVDLYQIHRWDETTPLAETLRALEDVVRSGKARYLGASSMPAWRFAQALHTAERNGWARFAAMQNHLNLLYREEEREMLPLCAAQGIGVLPWSPLARGRLTRDWRETSKRSQTDAYGKTLYDPTTEMDRRVIESVAAVAARLDVPRAQEPYAGLAMDIWIERLEPPRLFSFRWHPGAVDPVTDLAQEPTTVTFELEDSSGGTLLTITESGFDGIPLARRAKAFADNDEGWTAQAKLIEKYLAAAEKA